MALIYWALAPRRDSGAGLGGAVPKGVRPRREAQGLTGGREAANPTEAPSTPHPHPHPGQGSVGVAVEAGGFPGDPPFLEAAGPSRAPQARAPRRRPSAGRCCPLLGTRRRPRRLWEPRPRGARALGAGVPALQRLSRSGSGSAAPRWASGRTCLRNRSRPRSLLGPHPRVFRAGPPWRLGIEEASVGPAVAVG